MSNFAKFLKEIDALGNRQDEPPVQRHVPRPGITYGELQKALRPAGGNKFAKAIADVKRLQGRLKETLKSPEEKKQIAEQGRIQHQRAVLQKLGDLRQHVKEALMAGELTGDEAASLETQINAASERLYTKHLATIAVTGDRKIEPVQVGGGR